MDMLLQENYGISLNSVWLAEQLFENINNIEEKNVNLNFEGIIFISLSFAQAYIYFKRHSTKTIKEHNLSRENHTMLQVVADRYNMKIGTINY